MSELSEIFGDVIHAYSRADALADGYLVDVSEMAREAGIKFPVAITRAVWDRYCEPPDGVPGQDLAGRTWDVLWMLRAAIRAGRGGDRLDYQLYVAFADRGDWQANEAPPERGTGLSRRTHRRVTLKAICGPGDDPAPVITVLLPSED